MEGTADRSDVKRYGLALLVWAAALVLTLLFEPIMSRALFAFFMIAVVGASIYGGVGPGLTVVVLGAAAVEIFVAAPRGAQILTADHLATLFPFLIVATAITFLGASRLKAITQSRASQQLLTVTLRSIGDAVIVTDAAGKITFMNAIAEELTGWSEESAAGRALAEVFAIINEETGLPADSPVAKVLATGGIVGLANHTVLLARNGRRVPIEDSAAPIKDAAGEIEGVIMVFRDVARRRRSEIEGRFILEATELLSSSLEYRETLQRVSDLAVPNIADWCAVDILDEQGVLQRVAVAHKDPEKVEWAQEIYRRYPPDPAAPTGPYVVIRTGQAEFYPEITREMIDAANVDREQMEIIEKVGFTALMTVPLTVRGRTLGTITLVSAESGRAFERRDLELATELARNAAMAIENARLYEEARQSATARLRQASRMSILAETTSILSGAANNYRELLETVARRISDLMGDACVMRLLSDDRAYLDPVALYHPNPERLATLKSRVEKGRVRIDRTVLRRVVEDGEMIVVNSDELGSIDLKEEPLPIYEEENTSGFVLVPMRARGEVIGTLSLARDRGGADYTHDDRTLLQDLADRAALVIDNARLFRDADEQREWLGVTLSSIGDAVIATDTTGRVVFMNPVARNLTQWGEESIGEPLEKVFDIVNEETREVVESPVAKVLREGKVVGLANHTVLLGKMGSEVPIDDSAAPIRDVDGNLRGVVLVFHDITERKQAEQESSLLHLEVDRQRKRLDNLISSVPGVVWEAWGQPDESSQRIDYVSSYVEQLLGYSQEEWLSTPNFWLTIVHPEDRERAASEAAAIFASGRIGESQFRWVTRSGEARWIEARSSVILDDHGAPLGMRGVSMDITDRKEIESQLREAKETAEAASRTKDQFLAVLSHELRTPLTPVLATAQALETDPAVPEEIRPFIEIIRRNIELEVHLIDDLLDLVRVARGKVQLGRTVMSLHLPIDNVIDMCRSDIYQKKLELSVELGALDHYALIDPARMQQVFWNLLKNAVKFTPEGGRIAVRTFNADDGGIAVEVADSGIGIEPEVLPRIFNAFEQGEQTITRRFGGLGLGLAISRALVEMHDGRIEAASAGPGKGSVFTIRIPSVPSPAHLEPDAAPAASRNGGARNGDRNGDRSGARKGLRILLVDDHEDTNHVMKLLLERQGFDVIAASTFRQGLELGEREPFDLLISDIGLPDGSGLDLVRELRARRPVKAIALSGFGMEGDIQRSREAGFSEHLTKPVTFQKLFEIIQRLTTA